MLELHHGREGTILIAQMDDNHLRNTLNLMIRRLKDVYDAGNIITAPNPYMEKLYGFQKVDPEKSATLIRQAVVGMYPYMAEAFFRQLEGVNLNDLGLILGRDGQLFVGVSALPASSDWDEIYEEDDFDSEF